MSSSETAEALALLCEQGWTCIPPFDPNAEIPEPEVGQVWRSANARVEPRTVVWIGAHFSYPWAGEKCIGFTTPKRQPHPKWGPTKLPPDTWRAWARKTGARPKATNNG